MNVEPQMYQVRVLGPEDDWSEWWPVTKSVYDHYAATLGAHTQLRVLVDQADMHKLVEQLQRRIQNAELALKAQTQNCDTLRAQLAEAHALLRTVLNAFEGAEGHPWMPGHAAAQVKPLVAAALSASAPKCGNCGSGTGQACNDKGCGYLESGNGEQHNPREDLKAWFGLSYASWLTIPRVLLEAMPDVWQARLAVLLHEYEDAFPNHPEIGTTVRCTKGGRVVKTPDWMVNYRHPDQAMLKALRGDS